jgi:hypothetical protein
MNVRLINALTNAGIFQNQNIKNLSLAVKTVDLPKYEIKHETLNQYNRKRVIQSQINYNPVTITFHDDGGDNIRELWYQYYSYYYKDPSQQYGQAPSTNGSLGQIAGKTGMDYNERDIYAPQRSGNNNDWGFIGESYLDGTSGQGNGKLPFFDDIEIYGFDQHKYARYVLINPIITNWSHDQYDYSQGSGTMQNSMTVAYETVKYYSGALGKPDAYARWPDEAHYDTTPSPLARPGSTATIGGQGGLIATGEGILADLQRGDVMGLIGAAQKAGTAYNTFKGKNLASLAKSESASLGVKAIQGSIPGAVRSVQGRPTGMFFPTPQSPPTN